MHHSGFIFLLVQASLQVLGYNLTMYPPHSRISEDPNTLTVTCVAGVVLTGCQFIWRDEKHSGPVMELSQGGQSRTNPSHLDNFITDYRYNGRGLVAGDCGITLHVTGVKVWMIGCRVHAAMGGWKYAWTDLFAHSAGLLPNTVGAREAIVFPGTEAKLIVKAMVPLDLCHFYLPGVAGQINFDKGPHSTQSSGRHRYYGAGVQIGECGLVVYNVSEANNGPARCYIRNTRTTTDDYKYIPLIVARAPTPPALHGYYEGANIKATCTVSSSRPAPNMTWLLGEDMIRQDSMDDSPAEPQDDWRWPWMQTSMVQRMTHALRPEDDGKVLRCVVTHMTLSQPMEAVKRITFIQPPTSVDSNYGEQNNGDRSRMSDHQSRDNSNTPQSSSDEVGGVDVKSRESDVGVEATVAAPAEGLKGVAHHPGDALKCRGGLGPGCPPVRDDTREYRIREARADASAAELALESARSRVRAEESRARAEETRVTEAKLLVEAAQSRARAEEARARVEEALATAAEIMVRAAQARVRAEDARALQAEQKGGVAVAAGMPSVLTRGGEEARGGQSRGRAGLPGRMRDYEEDSDSEAVDRYQSQSGTEYSYGYIQAGDGVRSPYPGDNVRSPYPMGS